MLENGRNFRLIQQTVGSDGKERDTMIKSVLTGTVAALAMFAVSAGAANAQACTETTLTSKNS